MAHSPYLRNGRPLRVEAVAFDFDGTLTRPGAIDFAAVQEAVGCPRDTGLLEYLAGIADPAERSRKEQILGAAERKAAAECRVNEGAAELVAFLRQRGIPMAVVTRNSYQAVARAFANLPGIEPADFAAVVSRDLPLSPKPFPDGIRFVADKLGVDIGRLLVIGDHAFDVQAGRRAGALTMFLRNNPSEPSKPDGGADLVVGTLAEALEVIGYAASLPLGKVPAEVLADALAGIDRNDAAVLVGPGVGEDAAVIDIGRAELLVLASDPVTLATDPLARCAVIINANDVATTGATPRWLLSTVLFPAGSTASEVLALVRAVQEACTSCGVALCGGHTEISDVVSRPLVVGTMVGSVPRTLLMDKRRIRQGDRVLLTKGVAVEGTGLIAQEYGTQLREKGWTEAEIAEAAGFLERISILEEARIARSFTGVTALHDVTEGGLATAVRELGAAGGRRLRLDLGKIPVYLQTKRICAAFGLDPLGLIGSGSLLITCSPAEAGVLAEAISAAGIEVADIGEVLEEGEGIEGFRGGLSVEWPSFSRDEVLRLARSSATPSDGNG